MTRIGKDDLGEILGRGVNGADDRHAIHQRFPAANEGATDEIRHEHAGEEYDADDQDDPEARYVHRQTCWRITLGWYFCGISASDLSICRTAKLISRIVTPSGIQTSSPATK